MQRSGVWAHWNRCLNGRRKKQTEGEGEDDVIELDDESDDRFGNRRCAKRGRPDQQLTLDNLKGMMKRTKPSDSGGTIRRTFSEASTVVEMPRPVNEAPKQTGRVNTGFRPASALEGAPPSRGKGGLLHHPRNEETVDVDANDELAGWADVIQGEITADHVKQILSMRLPVSGEGKVEEETIGGLAEVKRIIKAKIIAPIKRPDLHIGLYKAATGILFYGPPGTGKTTLAKWIATESNAAFFNVTASGLISKFQGETESLVRALFLVAERSSPSVVFMDEIDGLIGKRRDKEEDSTLRMKNQLLQMMDGVGTRKNATVVVIGATNRPDAVDEAALRRFSKRVYVPLPDLDARLHQIRWLLDSHAITFTGSRCDSITDAELVVVAKSLEGFNGSDLQALCTKAAEYAYEEVVQKYGGIDKVPGPDSFRMPGANDLLKAGACIGRSSGVTDFGEWSRSYGCE